MPSPDASRRNLEKARARGRAPRPWRSTQETGVIRRLVWQWFTYRGPGKWSGRTVARYLGVSHTYIQKLVREFLVDSSKITREVRRSYPATFEQLNRAQRESREQKARGCLRPPRRCRLATLKLGDQIVRVVVPTKVGEVPRARTIQVPHEVPIWATEITYRAAEAPPDPFIAAKYAIRWSGQPLSLFTWQWRLYRPFR
jgi:hypothetical protein